MRRFANHLATKVRKKLRLGHSLGELDPELTGRPLLFRAPPLSPELLAAIRLISPQFHLRADEPSRRFWELNQNGLCWGEYLALEPFLERLGEPAAVLDIGPGLGRSTVFFKRVRDWQRVPFHLYEGSGSTTRYTRAGPRFDDSFCGDLDALETILRFNETTGYELFDAAELGASLAGLPGPYDFVYSFFAVGFHWSIEHFLDELLALMSERAIGAFTLHDRFDDLAVLDRVPHRIVEFRSSWPRGKRWRMVVLARRDETLPPAGGN